MSHELSIREDGFVEFAFTGGREAIWHSLGNELEVGAPIEKWRTQAGMDWSALESPVHYTAVEDAKPVTKTFADRKVILRSDTKAGLSIVSHDFKVVQPGQVLEFFRDLTERHGMRLSTAGCLFGGKRFWALAEMGKEEQIVPGDLVKGNLLLTTAVDGTMATTAKVVSTRVVCNNTLTMAMNEQSKNLVKRTHKVDFDPSSVKIDLGLIDAGWTKFIGDLKKMSNTKMGATEAREFFQRQFFKPDVLAEDQGWGVTRKVNQLMGLYNSGTGSDLSRGTAWGVLNAVTEDFTHGSGKRDASHQFWESMYGQNDNVKTRVFNALVTA